MSNGIVNGNGVNGDHKLSSPNGVSSFEEAKAQAAKKIRQEDIDHWHEHGFVIIKNFMTEEEIKASHADILRYMPTWEEYKAKAPMYADLEGGTHRRRGIGNEGTVRWEFPYDGDAINNNTVHPFLVAFVERLVGHSNLALSHGAMVGKYAGKGDYDQPLHCDYTGNTNVIPAQGLDWVDVPMILYLTDVTLDHGPTYVVSQTHTKPLNLVADGFRFHTRDKFPELYKHEEPVLVPAGSVVIHSMRTFHRGSAFLGKEGLRWIQFMAFHTAGIPWLGSHNFNGNSAAMDRFLSNASPEQRTLAGFPPVGHPYWNDPEVLEGVANRYPAMDMRPYGGGPPRGSPVDAHRL